MKIKLINDIKNDDKKIFKIKLGSADKESKPVEQVLFNVNDRVKLEDSNLYGKILEILDKYIIVLWDDKTKERFNKNNLNLLQKTDVQKEENGFVDNIIDSALNELEQENDLSNNLCEVENSIDKINENTKIESIKERNIDEVIVELKKKKVIQKESQEKLYIDKLNNMKISEFKRFKRIVFEKNEAELALEALRNSMFKINNCSYSVGDDIRDVDISNVDTRSLSSVKDNIVKKPETFADSLSSLNNMGNSSRNLSSVAENKSSLNLNGFKNIQGITKPLMVEANLSSSNPISGLKEQFSKLEWTIGGPK